MDLLRNPFHILTAAPRDNRQKIMELADERSLFLDSSECKQACADLTHPRKRLSPELAWLPGVGPEHANKVLKMLESQVENLIGMDTLMRVRAAFGEVQRTGHSMVINRLTLAPGLVRFEDETGSYFSEFPILMPTTLALFLFDHFKNTTEMDKLMPIAQANLLAAGLSRLPNYSSDDVAEWIVSEWIVKIANVFEAIDPEEVRTTINNERIVSRFPMVEDLSAIEMEIKERRHYYRRVITTALDNLSVKERTKVVTMVVEASTDNGENPGPILVDDLVDSYEINAQEFLEKEEGNIEVLDEKIRAAADAKSPDTALTPMVNQLIQAVKNWDTFAQPIQINKKIQGLSHDVSYRVAGRVRKLTIDLFNKYGKLDFAQQLTNMLQEVFAEVGEVAERTAEDAKALDEIAEQRVHLIEAAKKREEEWRREITYEADVGTFFFKNKLRISPEGIEWRGDRWDLDSITRIRWGGTRHSLNGVPTGTTYSIIFDYASIELKDETIYNNFIDRLWRAVGVRLLTEYLEGLRDGRKYRFGSAVISDHGVELERKRLFGSNERAFCRWSELAIWNGAGVFCIGKKEDRKLKASFSYQYEDNIHVLEAAIRMFWKRGGNRLSDLLEE